MAIHGGRRWVQISMSPHSWFGTDVPGGRWGIDNPDTQYFLVPLEAISSYVITGKRHAPGPIDSNFSFSNLDGWRTLSNIAHDQLQVAADGSYTITLDKSLANGRPNHVQLVAGGDALLIRNTLADWSRESADRLTVKRISGPPPRAALDDDALEQAIVTRLRGLLDHVIANLQAPVFKVPVNMLPQPGKAGDKAGFLVTQRNALGHFRLQADEALVVSINPGGAKYSTLPVTDAWGVSPEYWKHQSSLNNLQSTANPDGTITGRFSVGPWNRELGRHSGAGRRLHHAAVAETATCGKREWRTGSSFRSRQAEGLGGGASSRSASVQFG